jgi:hypothetical protein
MAARRFCAKVLTAGQLEEVMVGKTGFDSTVNLTFVNQGTSPAKVSLAYVNSALVEDVRNCDWLFFNATVNPGSIKEVKGVAVEEGHMLAAKFLNVGEETIVNVVAYGFVSPTINNGMQ